MKCATILAVVALLVLPITACASGGEDDSGTAPLVSPSSDLIIPSQVHVGDAPVTDRTRHVVQIARTLYTFWNTGDATYLDKAVDPSFVDNTLPPGRPQGPAGPIAASKAFRTAIPDLTCELADLYLTGDTFTARLIFRGHFTGTYEGKAGNGESIEFGAIDVQRVGNDRIVEDWHLEDNLTFLQQAGIVNNG